MFSRILSKMGGGGVAVRLMAVFMAFALMVSLMPTQMNHAYADEQNDALAASQSSGTDPTSNGDDVTSSSNAPQGATATTASQGNATTSQGNDVVPQGNLGASQDDAAAALLDLTPQAATTLNGGETIAVGGEYQLSTAATGVITISTTAAVTIIGNGAAWDTNFAMTSAPNVDVQFASTVAGVNITLKDAYITNSATVDTRPLIDFTGAGNKLNIEGVTLLEKSGSGQGTYALMHVAKGTDLTIGGAGTLYLYKQSGGSGIGGNKSEMNGDITFNMQNVAGKLGQAFMKGTKQGALVGAGTGASSTTDAPGFVKFTAGEFNLITNSRGAAIGGSAGESGGSTGTTVYVEQKASININVDYSGSAVGGGGYDGGNDSSGGTLYVNGGSLRTYVDKNAASNTTGWQGKPLTAGINDAPITAQRLNGSNAIVYMCAVPLSSITAQSGNYAYQATVDGATTLAYQGSIPAYGFVQEGLDKGEQLSITSTPSNWYANGESSIYLWLTGEDHTINVNGTPLQATWDAASTSFTVVAPAVPKVTAGITDGSETADGGTVALAKNDSAATQAGATAELEASEGDTIVVTPAAASGYYIAQVRYAPKVLEGETPAFIAISPDESGKYTFTMPADDVDVYADFVSVVWDGTVDITWYDPSKTSFNIQYAAQYEGLAAIVNGIFTTYPTLVDTTDKGVEFNKPDYSLYLQGMGAQLQPSETEGEPALLTGSALYGEFTSTYQLTDMQHATTSNVSERTAAITKTMRVIGNPGFVTANCSTGSTGSSNKVTTNDYYYGDDDFNGKAVYVTADLDFGATRAGNGDWDVSSPLFMSVGGAYSMLPGAEKTNGYAKISANWNGVLDGQGHSFKNVYGERYANTEYGDSSAFGLVGRLGNNDGDAAEKAALNPSVRQIVFESGYISGRRSIGGIVGKIGKTTASKLYDGSTGGIIEYCINKADVRSTDSKGVGGVVGAAWNGGIVRYCANLGDITSTYSSGTVGGIAGNTEVMLVDCYNAGTITGTSASSQYALGIGTNNGGVSAVNNCYWRLGSAGLDYNTSRYSYGGYYGSQKGTVQGESKNGSWSFGTAAITTLTGTPVTYSPDYATLTAALLNADGLSIWKDDTSGTNSYAGVSYPVLYYQSTSYDPVTTYTVTVEQPIEGGTVAATPLSGSFATTVSLSNTPALGYEFDHYVVAGKNLTDDSFQLGANTTVTCVFRQSHSYAFTYDTSSSLPYTLQVTKTGIVRTGGVASAVTDLPVASGDTIYEGDILTYAATLKPGVAPEDVDTDYTGSFTYKTKYGVNTSGGDLTRTGASYTVAGSETIDEISLQSVTCATAQKTWLMKADTSWYDAENPQASYALSTPEQLAGMAKLLNEDVTFEGVTISLAQNISLANNDGTTGRRLWAASNSSKYFKGAFDGAGKKITDMNANATNAALLGWTQNATVKNVEVFGVAKGSKYASGIVCYAETTTFEDCVSNVEASTTGNSCYGGGVAAYATNSTFARCKNHGAIIATAGKSITNTGGIVGTAVNTALNLCANDGAVTGNTYVGGIVGSLGYATGGTVFPCIEACSNVGNVAGTATNGTSNCAGLAGNISSAANVSQSYNAGAISATGTRSAFVGGLIGNLSKTTSDPIFNIENCYNAGAVSSCQDAAGIIAYVNGAAWQTSNVYNSGSITKGEDGTDIAAPFVASVWGASTGSAETNSYYLEGCAPDATSLNGGSTVTDQKATAKSSNDLKAAAPVLGAAFASDYDIEALNGGYPILLRQQDPAPFTLSFMDTDNVTVLESYTAPKGYTADSTGIAALFQGQAPEKSVTGYDTSFIGWVTEVNGTTLAMLSDTQSDTALYAGFDVDAIAYHITYNLDGGTNSASNPAAYTIESNAITLAAPEKEGHVFSAWKNADGQVVTGIAAGSTGNVELTAVWTKNSYPVSYVDETGASQFVNLQFGSTVTVDGGTPQTVGVAGISVSAPSQQPAVGYGSIGYKAMLDDRGNLTLTTTSGSLQVYDITYNVNGGTNSASNPATYTVESDAITFAAPVKSGCVFKGWLNASDGRVTGIAAGSVGDVALSASWMTVSVEMPDPSAGVTVDKASLQGVLDAMVAGNPDASSIVVSLEVDSTNISALGKEHIEAGLNDGESVVVFEATLYATIDGVKVNIGSNNTSLVKMSRPFDFTGKAAVRVLVSHEGEVIELSETPNSLGECFVKNVTSGTIDVYSTRYSTYGVASTAAMSAGDPAGGNAGIADGSSAGSIGTKAVAKTGDATMTIVCFALAMAVAAGAVLLGARRKRAGGDRRNK